jgi:hypothetical protein
MNPIEMIRIRLDGGRHWYQGGPIGFSQAGLPAVCLLLALDQDDQRAYELQDRLISAVIEEQFPERRSLDDGYTSPIPSFNDHPATTWNDVDLVLHKATLMADELVV